MTKESNRRRTFLSKMGLSLLSVPFIARSTDQDETNVSGETQFMLTQDGELVEIPNTIYKNASSRSDVRRRKKLWTWLTSSKSRPKSQ